MSFFYEDDDEWYCFDCDRSPCRCDPEVRDVDEDDDGGWSTYRGDSSDLWDDTPQPEPAPPQSERGPANDL